MKFIIVFSILSVIMVASCQKQPISKSALPPYIISLQMITMPNEFVSVYYIDSVTHQKTTIKITSSNAFAYLDSIPTSNFFSQYLFDACGNNGIKNFKLKFYRSGVTELHDLFIDFKWLPLPGGFQIPDAQIDGKTLINSPVDIGKYGQIATVFIYNR